LAGLRRRWSGRVARDALEERAFFTNLFPFPVLLVLLLFGFTVLDGVDLPFVFIVAFFEGTSVDDVDEDDDDDDNGLVGTLS
jgi:hypothetical protein